MKNALIVDDHPLIRMGVKQLVQSEWPEATVREADTIASALQSIADVKPDVITLDLGLPDTSGAEGVKKVLRAAGETPVLILSFNDEAAIATRLFQMGIAGYVQKDRASDELLMAIRRVLDGKRYVTDALADRLLDLLDGKPANVPPHELLSAQEYRVMLLLAEGKGASDIAETMHLSAKTVTTYRARIMEKTGWKSNVELSRYCVQHKLTS